MLRKFLVCVLIADTTRRCVERAWEAGYRAGQANGAARIMAAVFGGRP